MQSETGFYLRGICFRLFLHDSFRNQMESILTYKENMLYLNKDAQVS